ncbi:MAG TPA: NAD-dependent epimerase/dehydratase family protein, partial [Nakamurella sp.]
MECDGSRRPGIILTVADNGQRSRAGHGHDHSKDDRPVTSTCLVTGGAGFIGCALSPTLSDHFDRVVAMDNLHPQVHPARRRPDELDRRVEFVRAD